MPLAIFLAALWLVLYIADHLPIRPPWHAVVCVVLAVIGLVILLHGHPLELR